MNFIRYFFLAIVIFVAGCATQPSKPAAVAPTQGSWQAQGRLAALQGEKGGNASFVWQQKGESYLIRLFGPFGSGAVVIKNYPAYVELKEANGKITRAQTPELLMQKLAGWQVPLSGLQYWLRAMPIPGQTHTQEKDNSGHLSLLEQQGWKIFYESYRDNHLPSKLRLENGNVRVKMIVTEWTQ